VLRPDSRSPHASEESRPAGPALRGFSSQDFEALYLLDQACYPPGIAYSRRMLKWFLRLPGASCTVAEGEPPRAEIIGFILTDSWRERGHIITLDVAAPARRQGVGSALLAAAERRLALAGVRRVTLETAVDNAPAIAFWHKHGYRTCGLLENYYQNGLDAYAMLKAMAAEERRRG
jgi:ribosomal-protein-alanine N-acetyltransferase